MAMGKARLGVRAAVLASLFSVTVRAQTPSVTIVDVGRELPRGNLEPTKINQADCLGNDSVTLTLALEQYQSYALEVWAGDGCDSLANRRAANASCWQVSSVQPSNALTTVKVGIRELLRGRTRASNAEEGVSLADDAACELSSPVSAPQTLTTYVMLIDANAQVSAQVTWKSTYRLRGSLPPEVVSVTSGEGELSVQLSPINPDPFFAGVQLFCDPAPSDADAAANAQVTTDDAGVFVPECPPSTELIAGAPAAALQHLRCGDAQANALSASAKDLVNGVSYNIAAASVDTYGNLGPLSPVSCAVPQAKSAPQSTKACAFAGPASAPHGLALAGCLGFAVAFARRRHGVRARSMRR